MRRGPRKPRSQVNRNYAPQHHHHPAPDYKPRHHGPHHARSRRTLIPALLALGAVILGLAALSGSGPRGLNAGNFFGGQPQPVAASSTPSPGALLHPLPVQSHPDVPQALRVRSWLVTEARQDAAQEARRDKRQEARQDAAQQAAAQQAAQAAAAPQPSAQAPAAAPQYSSSGNAAASPLGVCIRNAEEGGSYAWGPGNGGGAYQFLLGTWEAYGGAASEYGVAGPAYQDQIFDNAIAAGGASNWTLYDGC
jgi:pyruvate/2-oxoglutarate dehydrogenase complex dihydrolipoamide acyltransferase (E2) component